MKSLFYFSIVIIVSLSLYGCNNHPSDNLAGENKSPENIIAHAFRTGDGWGYTVFINDKLFIKQSFVPVIEGNKGFANEEDAMKVATLVVDKLKHHEKPTVRLDELQQFGLVKR